jgi:hypothetical protein
LFFNCLAGVSDRSFQIAPLVSHMAQVAVKDGDGRSLSAGQIIAYRDGFADKLFAEQILSFGGLEHKSEVTKSYGEPFGIYFAFPLSTSINSHSIARHRFGIVTVPSHGKKLCHPDHALRRILVLRTENSAADVQGRA